MAFHIPKNEYHSIILFTKFDLNCFSSTWNSSLEPLLEGLFAQIQVNPSRRVFCRNRIGDLRITRFLKCRALHHWAKVTDESPTILKDPRDNHQRLRLSKSQTVWLTVAWSESPRPRLNVKTWRLIETETWKSVTKIKEVFCRVVRFRNFWQRSWLFEPNADWIGSILKKCKCVDFESIKPTNNWQDH